MKAGRKPKKKDMELGLKIVINMYHARGLRVIQVNTDNEFECIREEVRPINMNKVGDIERLGRTVNEGTRYHVHLLPYIRYPKQLVVGYVAHVIKF